MKCNLVNGFFCIDGRNTEFYWSQIYLLIEMVNMPWTIIIIIIIILLD
jgi:hypothetical protein